MFAALLWLFLLLFLFWRGALIWRGGAFFQRGALFQLVLLFCGGGGVGGGVSIWWRGLGGDPFPLFTFSWGGITTTSGSSPPASPSSGGTGFGTGGGARSLVAPTTTTSLFGVLGMGSMSFVMVTLAMVTLPRFGPRSRTMTLTLWPWTRPLLGSRPGFGLGPLVSGYPSPSGPGTRPGFGFWGTTMPTTASGGLGSWSRLGTPPGAFGFAVVMMMTFAGPFGTFGARPWGRHLGWWCRRRSWSYGSLPLVSFSFTPKGRGRGWGCQWLLGWLGSIWNKLEVKGTKNPN